MTASLSPLQSSRLPQQDLGLQLLFPEECCELTQRRMLCFVSHSALVLQFPQHYAAISETNQPAELIPQFSTIEYQLQVRDASGC